MLENIEHADIAMWTVTCFGRLNTTSSNKNSRTIPSLTADASCKVEEPAWTKKAIAARTLNATRYTA